MQVTVQIISMENEIFCITQEILQVDEETSHNPLQDIYHLELALPRVPTKVLYKFKISVAHEIQSRDHVDGTSIQLANKVKMTLC
jgi:hypothetical protein